MINILNSYRKHWPSPDESHIVWKPSLTTLKCQVACNLLCWEVSCLTFNLSIASRDAMGDTSLTVGNDFWKQIRPIRPNRCITQPLQRLHTLSCARLLDRRDRRKIRDARSGKVGSDLALPSPRAFFAWAFTISARYQRPLRWCYTERFPATILSATQRCNVGTML